MRRREAGYLLAAAMVLVAVVSISMAKAARDLETAHRRELELELKFRGARIVRAIAEWKEDLGGAQWPTLEQLTKDAARRYLPSIPPEPLTARYDEDGKLEKGTGLWQPIYPGRAAGGIPSPAQHEEQSGRGGIRIQPAPNPVPCTQKVPSPEKVPLMGVYSCADGTAIMLSPDGKPGLPYQQWYFVPPPPYQNVNLGTSLPILVQSDVVDPPAPLQ